MFFIGNHQGVANGLFHPSNQPFPVILGSAQEFPAKGTG
jgi:hypothetical protein